jgi:hypothetical protein
MMEGNRTSRSSSDSLPDAVRSEMRQELSSGRRTRAEQARLVPIARQRSSPPAMLARSLCTDRQDASMDLLHLASSRTLRFFQTIHLATGGES